mmetsp:Transcript_23291/g.76526  ORF Transcript_23291/g.76526 Transcript_23291/m.76526 type:complete len:104 (-) Transcript_23291:1389-1700(-)
MPSRFTSSACVPASATTPPETTKMASALRTVDRRWDTESVVMPPRSWRWSSVDWTSFSLALSSADVASSKSRSFGFLRKARAMEMRCFWPPEMRTPRSPTCVS